MRTRATRFALAKALLSAGLVASTARSRRPRSAKYAWAARPSRQAEAHKAIGVNAAGLCRRLASGARGLGRSELRRLCVLGLLYRLVAVFFVAGVLGVNVSVNVKVV